MYGRLESHLHKSAREQAGTARGIHEQTVLCLGPELVLRHGEFLIWPRESHSAEALPRVEHTVDDTSFQFDIQIRYGHATDYKKSVLAKCFLNSWYFRGYGPGYGMLFHLFSAILCYS